MTKDGTSKWINLVFVLVIIAIIIWIFASQKIIDLQNTMGIVGITLIIIIVVFVIVYFASRYLMSFSRSSPDDRLAHHMDEDSYEYSSNIESTEKQSSAPQVEDDFGIILRSIEEGFNPGTVKDEEDSENQLIQFLNTRFPNKALSRGRTSAGEQVDIVIDGTYCIELAVVNNEARLISLMDQILKSKRDFGEVAVVLLNFNEVPAYTIEKYVDAYKNAGARVIVKKV